MATSVEAAFGGPAINVNRYAGENAPTAEGVLNDPNYITDDELVAALSQSNHVMFQISFLEGNTKSDDIRTLSPPPTARSAYYQYYNEVGQRELLSRIDNNEEPSDASQVEVFGYTSAWIDTGWDLPNR